MEIWFIVAVCGAIASGLSNFFFKVAAAKGCNAELFIFYSAITSIVVTTALLVIWPQPILGFGWIGVIILVSGMLSAYAGGLKVYALRYIDSTIYFPLFKLIVPALAIAVGVTYFKESFSLIEWVGMCIGLLVPLMLITQAENKRQNNLFMGLLLVVVTGGLSTVVAVLAKYAIVSELPVNTTLLFTVLGISLGSIVMLVKKNGVRNVLSVMQTEGTILLITTAIARSILIVAGVWAMLFAYSSGGTLAVVQTIHSMYILIPIVLAVFFFKEHWSWQKALAIILSVVSLVFLG